MPDCIELVINCKGCKRIFERHERMVHCPDCGKKRECNHPPLKGYNRCREHGGPRPEVGYYGRRGRFSMTNKVTSPMNEMAAKYLEIQSDPRSQTLRPLHSMINARLMVVLERVDAGDSAQRMEKLVKLWERFKRLHPGLDQYYHGAEAITSLRDIDEEFEATVHDYAAWQEIINLIDVKQKVSVSEMKILKDMKALISAEDVTDLVAQVLAAVARIVNDSSKLEQIQFELASIIGDSATGGFEEGEREIIDIRPGGMDSGQILHSGDPERSDPEGEDHNDGLSEGHIEGGVLEG